MIEAEILMIFLQFIFFGDVVESEWNDSKISDIGIETEKQKEKIE